MPIRIEDNFMALEVDGRLPTGARLGRRWRIVQQEPLALALASKPVAGMAPRSARGSGGIMFSGRIRSGSVFGRAKW
jgi:hypothetical protein